MSERIASGEIEVRVDDKSALAALKRIDAEFDKTMKEIDRKEADVKIRARLDDLKKDLKKAEAEVAAAEKRMDDASNDRAKKRAKIEQDAAQKRMKAIQRQIAGDEGAIKSRKALNNELSATEQRLVAIAKREEAQAKLDDANAKKKAASTLKQQRLNDRTERQELAELSRAQRRERQRQKEIADVPKLESAYVRLHDKLDKLNNARRKARGDEKATLLIDLDEKDALHQIESIRREVRRRVGRDPIDIPIKLQTGRRSGEALRAEMLKHQGALLPVAAAVGISIGAKMGHSTATSFRKTMDKGVARTMGGFGKTLAANSGRGLVNVFGRIGKAAEGLAEASVRLGPFTTSIRGAITGLSLMAPILLDVVGALGSLVGVAGSAALGAGALGIAFAGGAIPALLGFGIVIKQVVGQFKDIAKAQKAYDDALQKGDTKGAAKKMKELKATMGNVSEETVKAVGSWDKVQASFKKGTTAARGSVFTSIGEGIKTARVMMDDFTHNTNVGMDHAEKATTKWMKALRSPEGRKVLGEMMTNFNRSIEPALGGLGKLVAYLGKVGAVASRSLPGLARGFDNWASKLLGTADNADILNKKVDGVITSAKNVGKFFMASGRLMKAFFGQGVESGNSFIVTMTRAMDRWTAMISAPGNNSVKDFFKESVAGAQALYGTLAPIIAAFVSWAANIAPFARAFFDGAAGVSAFVAELLKLTGLRSPLAALATTLGVLWGIGKIRNATAAISNFTAGLLGVQRAGAGIKGAQIGSNIAQIGTAASRGRGVQQYAAPIGPITKTGETAAKAAGGLTKMARAGRIASGSIGALGSLVVGTSSVTAGLGVIAVGAAYGLYKLSTRTREWEKSAQAADKQGQSSRDAMAVLAPTNLSLAQSTITLGQAQNSLKQINRQAGREERELSKLRKEGKKDTAEYKDLTLQHKDTLLQARSAQLSETAATRDRLQLSKDVLTQARIARRDASKKVMSRMDTESSLGSLRMNGTDGFDTVASAYDKVSKAAKASGQSIREWVNDNRGVTGSIDIGKLEEYEHAVQNTAAANRELIRATNAAYLGSLNQKRGLQGLAPIADQAAASFAYLNKKIGGKKTQEIALKFKGAGQAEKVAKSAGASLRAGVPKQVVTKITANSKSSEEAVRRLQRVRLTPKTLKIIEKGGAAARQVISDLAGKKIPQKTMKLLASDADAKTKVAALVALGIPTKTAKIIADASQADSEVSRMNSTQLKELRQAINRFLSNPGYTGPPMPTITQTVRRVVQGMGRSKLADGGGAVMGGRAYGAMPDARKQDRADRTAALSGNNRPFVSGKVNRPTYLVGEEATPEFVVSTNPKYRERNQRYAAMAARAVGLNVDDQAIRAASGFTGIGGTKVTKASPAVAAKGKKGKPGYKPGKAAVKANPAAEYHPLATFAPPKYLTGKKKPKTVKSKFKANSGWADYITGLQTQQGYWEREVGIRESQVKEPEDQIVRDPANDKVVKDTKGNPVLDADGKEQKIEAFKANPEIESSYKPALQKVMDAMTTLMKIVMELVRAIPLAAAANNAEIDVWGGRKTRAEAKMASEKKLMKGKKGDAKQKHQDRYDNAKDDRDEAVDKIRDLRDDGKELKAARIDAGFDYREFAIAKGKYQEDYNTVNGKATASATEKMTDQEASLLGGSGGGGGGGGSDAGAITYGQQVGLADTEKASVLRDFASNFAALGSNPGGVGGAVSGTGQGMQGNIASLGGIAGGGSLGGGGVAADLTAGRTAMSSSSAAASTVGARSGGTSGSTTAAGGAEAASKTVTINNTFATVPPDPHTWAKGTQFEISASL
jgi:hypothetical protein